MNRERGIHNCNRYVDYEYLRKNAAINLVTLANNALAPREPANRGIVDRGLSNRTTLKWEIPSKR